MNATAPVISLLAQDGPGITGAGWRLLSERLPLFFSELGAVLRGGPDELYSYLLVAGVLFLLGLLAMITRRNFFGLLMGVELVLNAAALNFVAFCRFPVQGARSAMDGQVFALFIIVLAAAEAVVAMALALAVWQMRRTVDLDEIDELRL